MSEISVAGRDITIGDDEYELDYEIRSAIKHNGMIIVLFELSDEAPQQNVIGLSRQGTRKWKIQPSKNNSSFVGITKRGGDVQVLDYDGNSYIIDESNGSIEKYRWGK